MSEQTFNHPQKEDWRTLAVKQNETIINTLKIIDTQASQFAIVIDDSDRLIGTVTDGDIRRGLLKGKSLENTIDEVMHTTPFSMHIDAHTEELLAVMRNKGLRHIPIIDDNGAICHIATLKGILKAERLPNSVVIMAGGMGSRLAPLTDNCPKPMLKVGNKPVLETIIENFIEQKFYKFYISVNYMGDVIKEHFGNGEQWGVQIEYLEEQTPLGTAGALHLIDEPGTNPLIVINGDLLTKVNFKQLLAFHSEMNSEGTMCVKEYDFQVPYGVVKTSDHILTGIVEKPVHRFFVNAGIYVINPKHLESIPENKLYNITTLFEDLIKEKNNVTTFPIREYWLDIGQIPDFHKANQDFEENFS